MSSVYCSSALLLRLLSPVSLLLSLCWSPHIMLAMVLMPCSTAGAELTGSLVVWRLGGSGGLREEEEEVLESWPGSGDTSECRSEEIPEEVEPVELDLGTRGITRASNQGSRRFHNQSVFRYFEIPSLRNILFVSGC